MTKSISISGRIAEEDYNYLMEYNLSGKVTASEKLRYICNFFRQYHQNQTNFDECNSELYRKLEPFIRNLKNIEYNENMHSEIIGAIIQVLPEMMATLIISRAPEKNEKNIEYLINIEKRMFDLTMSLFESILRMGLTSKAPTYNSLLFEKNFETVVELVDLIKNKN